MKESYIGLSQLDSILGNWNSAYLYHKLYSKVKDSLFNEESNKQMTEMQTKYETGKKESEIKLLQKEQEVQRTEVNRQKILKNSFVIGFGLILIVAFLFYNRYRLKQKANLQLTQQNIIIEEEKKKASSVQPK